MYREIKQLDEFEKALKESPALLAYFSTDECNVCKILKPKVGELILSNFPQIELAYINLNRAHELAGLYRVFAVPTIVIFFENRELIRKSRNFGIHELEREINRPYALLFS